MRLLGGRRMAAFRFAVVALACGLHMLAAVAGGTMCRGLPAHPLLCVRPRCRCRMIRRCVRDSGPGLSVPRGGAVLVTARGIMRPGLHRNLAVAGGLAVHLAGVGAVAGDRGGLRVPVGAALGAGAVAVVVAVAISADLGAVAGHEDRRPRDGVRPTHNECGLGCAGRSMLADAYQPPLDPHIRGSGRHRHDSEAGHGGNSRGRRHRKNTELHCKPRRETS
mmetsp:Transcript_173784/g.556972  ORF Transcript_173784/g.556972 Transcript_173784/m.556972 type:complete len:221 (+) Transcript_173784:1311-1973(+)